jgi:hypothetical protein
LFGSFAAVEHPSDGYGAKVQPCPRQNLSDLDLPERWAKRLKSDDDVADEVRETYW